MAEERKLAIDVVYVGVADPGDGVPGTSFTQVSTVESGSIQYNSDKPWAVILKAGEADTLVLNIPSPTMDERKLFMGGELNGTKDEWKKPVVTPSIRKTLMLKTKPYGGKQLVYTFVNCDVFGKITQLPGEDTTEILQVQFTVLGATTAAGVENTPMIVESKDAA